MRRRACGCVSLSACSRACRARLSQYASLGVLGCMPTPCAPLSPKQHRLSSASHAAKPRRSTRVPRSQAGMQWAAKAKLAPRDGATGMMRQIGSSGFAYEMLGGSRRWLGHCAKADAADAWELEGGTPQIEASDQAQHIDL